MSDLAEKSDLGIATVSRAEAGRPVSMRTLRRLAAAFVRYPPLAEVGALLDNEDGTQVAVALSSSEDIA